jgi:hypothetical protein
MPPVDAEKPSRRQRFDTRLSALRHYAVTRYVSLDVGKTPATARGGETDARSTRKHLAFTPAAESSPKTSLAPRGLRHQWCHVPHSIMCHRESRTQVYSTFTACVALIVRVFLLLFSF